MPQTPQFPYPDGDVTVLGPEVFVSADGQVISWKGENFTRESASASATAPPTVTGPALQYTTSAGNHGGQAVQRIDIDSPSDPSDLRERAICRALLHHALALLDATEPPRQAPVGTEGWRP